MTDVRLTRDLLADGFTHNELARLTRSGDLMRLRRGAYAQISDDDPGGAARHLRVVEATVQLISAEAVVSHVSAAVAHGLPVFADQLERVQLTRPDVSGGMAQARRVAAFLNARSESPGESLSRVVLHTLRLPPPIPQYEVFDDEGRLVGRADFGWEQYRTLGEFDGRVKYGRLLKPGETAADVVYREKLREDALRDQVWEMVRWTFADLSAPKALEERVRRAFARGLTRR